MTALVELAERARRAVMCPLGLCRTFSTNEDEHGIWGECSKCGKRAGYISRATLRAYADREVEAALNPHPDTSK